MDADVVTRHDVLPFASVVPRVERDRKRRRDPAKSKLATFTAYRAGRVLVAVHDEGKAVSSLDSACFVREDGEVRIAMFRALAQLVGNLCAKQAPSGNQKPVERA